MAKTRASARARAKPGATPQLRDHMLELGASQVPLFSGAVHYFRLKPSAWRPALEGVRSMGMPIVETYVPWGVHERKDGSFDFGEHDPHNNLAAFLDIAQQLGLYVFVRPGPNINAELTYFGLPARIIHDPDCQARSPRGNPVPFIAPPKMFPVPSYASERFLEETERWFAAVAEVVRPRLWPQGPVVMVQVDNEASFYFRDGPFDQDYHPDAITKYRDFVHDRYGVISALNTAYATDFTRWDEVEPPRRFEADRLEAANTSLVHASLRRSLEFMEFQESLLAGALTRMRDALDRVGLGALPTVHNLAMGEGGFAGTLAGLERTLDCVGIDYYHRRSDLRTVKERTLRLAGSVRTPYAPEFGAGAPPFFPPRSDADSFTTLMCACAFGLRGFNLYMAVDRDRWYGAPFNEDARPRPSAELYRSLCDALARNGFSRLRRRVQVGISWPKEYARLSRATHMLGALSPSLLDLAGTGVSAACLQDPLGFASAIQTEWKQYATRFASALTQAGIPYVWIDSDAEPARYADLRVLIAPTYEFAARTRFSQLHELAAQGGQVIYGPRLPHLDEALEPHAFDLPSGARLIDAADQTGADEIVAQLVDELDLTRSITVAPRSIECTVHESEAEPRMLFVVHYEAGLVNAEIHLPTPMALTDLLSAERYEGMRSVTIPMSGPTCRMFTCERIEAPVQRRSKFPSARRSDTSC